MKHNYLFIGAVGAMLLMGTASVAAERQAASLSTRGANKVLSLPAAAGNSHVISLGEAVDPETGKAVEGLAIVRYRDNHAKPDGVGNGNGGGKNKASACYEYLGRGAKWRVNEPWVVNPSNLDGLDHNYVASRLAGDISKWEAAADYDILGAGSSTFNVLVADTQAPDGNNEVYFADIDSSGAIGVTIVWGIFSGPPQGRELVEWDQVYDDVDFEWTADAASESGKMDFESISTHELGHTVGMGDLYTAECNQETMYGYATEGEVIKRDLNTGDIEGISGLY